MGAMLLLLMWWSRDARSRAVSSFNQLLRACTVSLSARLPVQAVFCAPRCKSRLYVDRIACTLLALAVSPMPLLLKNRFHVACHIKTSPRNNLRRARRSRMTMQQGPHCLQ